jgi:hypothetical protein
VEPPAPAAAVLPSLVGVRILVLADVIDKAGGVALVLCRPAGCLVTERTVVHQTDRLKCMALWAEAVEKVRRANHGVISKTTLYAAP